MPSELRAEMTRSGSLGLQGWIEARKENDFKAFLPELQRNLELRRQYIACFDGDFAEPYDALLDDYERGMTSAEVRPLFAYVKEHQSQLVKDVAAAGALPKPPSRAFDLERQKMFELEVVRRFGYDDESWRLDPTVHPFATGAGTQDIRITTRYFDDNLDGLFATMHECGHGLYEHQIDQSLERTLARTRRLARPARVAEPHVGEPRRPLAAVLALLLPAPAGALPGGARRRGRRVVVPRGERGRAVADPRRRRRVDLQPARHPALRARAGHARGDRSRSSSCRRSGTGACGSTSASRCPTTPAACCRTSTGRAARSATSRPTRSGNLISAQLWERILADIPDLYEQFERGEFVALREWLREHLHRHGRKFTPAETLERAVGSKTIDPEPYVRYLRAKVGEIYGLPAAAA